MHLFLFQLKLLSTNLNDKNVKYDLEGQHCQLKIEYLSLLDIENQASKNNKFEKLSEKCKKTLEFAQGYQKVELTHDSYIKALKASMVLDPTKSEIESIDSSDSSEDESGNERKLSQPQQQAAVQLETAITEFDRVARNYQNSFSLGIPAPILKSGVVAVAHIIVSVLLTPFISMINLFNGQWNTLRHSEKAVARYNPASHSIFTHSMLAHPTTVACTV